MRYRLMLRPLDWVMGAVSATQSRISVAANGVQSERPASGVPSDQSSKLGTRLRRLLPRRIDSAQHSQGDSSQSHLPSHGPLDPQRAAELAAQFVAYKEGIRPGAVPVTQGHDVVTAEAPLPVPVPEADDSGSYEANSCSSSEASQIIPAGHLPLGIQVGYTIPEEALSHDPPQSTDGNKKQNEALKLAVDIDIYVEGPKNGVEDNNNKKLDKYALGGLDRDSSSSLAYSITLNAPKKRNQYAKDVNKRGFTDEERKMRRQHDFFKDNAYGAVQGHGYLMANLLHITRMLERPGNPSVELQSISFRKSDLSETDWNWLNRLKICHELYHVAERQLISDDHLDIILSQLFPSNRYEVMTGPHFKVFMADFIKEATWCEKALGKKIVELQTSTEELRVGPYVDIQPPVRRVSPNFQALPMVHVPSDPSRDSRLKALAYLVEEMVYECNDWHGIYYEDASGTFSKYYEAWEQTRSGVAAEKLPSDLMEYHRDWTFHEQRLLRAGHLLLDLLRRVNAGVLNVMVYRVIRGTILGIQGQPFAEFDDIESLLYTKTSEPGLEVADIPQILILHPDLGISCPHDEAKHYSGLLANASRFEEEEKARLEDIEQAKQAFAKATGANRLSHRIKRRVKKMFGKQQQAPTFHCIGCLQGGCCVGQ